MGLQVSVSFCVLVLEAPLAVIAYCHQGEKFLDSLDDMAIENVVLIDGMAIWGPQKAVGLVKLKMWLAAWLQQYDVNAAIVASTATPTSNKVCYSCVMALAKSM